MLKNIVLHIVSIELLSEDLLLSYIYLTFIFVITSRYYSKSRIWIRIPPKEKKNIGIMYHLAKEKGAVNCKLCFVKQLSTKEFNKYNPLRTTLFVIP